MAKASSFARAKPAVEIVEENDVAETAEDNKIAMAREAKLVAAQMDQTIAQVAEATTARRLSDNERAEILRLYSEGKKPAAISEIIKTSVATVSKVLKNGGVGFGRGARNYVQAAPAITETQQRLIRFAVATLSGSGIDETERDALKELINEKVRRAQQDAIQRALMEIG